MNTSLASNQYLLQQLLKLFLSEKGVIPHLLLKWTLNVLQQQESRMFVEALVHELKNASNMELAD